MTSKPFCSIFWTRKRHEAWEAEHAPQKPQATPQVSDQPSSDPPPATHEDAGMAVVMLGEMADAALSND